MRLVHYQQRDRHLTDEVAETLVLQSLHRDHQDLQFAGLGPRHGFAGLLAALRRVDAAGGDAMPLQKGQLILHQRQQRRDHQGEMRQQQRRQLIAQRLARPRGKDRRRRAAGHHGANGPFLAGTKAVVAECLFERLFDHAESLP